MYLELAMYINSLPVKTQFYIYLGLFIFILLLIIIYIIGNEEKE